MLKILLQKNDRRVIIYIIFVIVFVIIGGKNEQRTSTRKS